MTYPGFFIAFEGGDGAGKSTQIGLLAQWLRGPDAGEYAVMETREPGGTKLGVELRQAVMHGDHVAPRAEALLYAADRAHHVHTKVLPALERGDIVITDRYMDSSIAYQGGARGLGADEVEAISRFATDGLVPDVTVLLDLRPGGLGQRMDRDLDRVERETVEHAELIRERFLGLAARAPARYVVVDAAADIETVHAYVKAAVASALAVKALHGAPGAGDAQ